jgi:hypothetical protein
MFFKNINSIIRLTSYFSLSIEQQIRQIFATNNVLASQKQPRSDDETITDIQDGRIYKRFIDDLAETNPHFNKNDIFSFLINTDGVSFCTKSKLTM